MVVVGVDGDGNAPSPCSAKLTIEGPNDVMLLGKTWRRLTPAMSAERTRIACWVDGGGIGVLWPPSATLGRRSNESKRGGAASASGPPILSQKSFAWGGWGLFQCLLIYLPVETFLFLFCYYRK